MARRTIWSVLAAVLLCLVMLPVTALAAAPGVQIIYAGNEDVTNGGYWTTDSDGSVTPYTEGGAPTGNYIHYDAADNTLILHNATIKTSNNHENVGGSAIGVLNGSGDAALTIQLEGNNTIEEVSKGIYVLASSESTGSSSLTITGDDSLNANGSQNGIRVVSNGGDATLIINSAKVKAVGGTYTSYSGVLVQAKNDSDASLTVDGGNLTASGNTGISFWFGTGTSGSGTPSLTVSNNAIVRANGGIASNASAATPSGTGIVFDGRTGTVYGDVTLQEDLEIGEGESLTIPDGASLNTGSHEVIVDGGTLTGGDKITGTVRYAPPSPPKACQTARLARLTVRPLLPLAPTPSHGASPAVPAYGVEPEWKHYYRHPDSGGHKHLYRESGKQLRQRQQGIYPGHRPQADGLRHRRETKRD